MLANALPEPIGARPSIRIPEPITVELPDPVGAEDIHFRDYWHILVRHRWIALAFVAVVVASTLLVTLVTVPVYRGTTLLEIKAETQKLIAFQDVVQMSQVEREFYQTHYDVLRSRSLAKRVIDRLDLAADPVFNPPNARPGLVTTVVGWLSEALTPHPPSGHARDSAAEQRLIQRFLDAVDVSPRRNSYLVEVSFLSPSPLLAQAVANALAEEYVAMSLDQRLDAVQKGRAFIERQLAITKAALERSEEELQAFARANEILTVDTKQNIEYRKLGDLNAALTKAQHERMVKESLYRQVTASEARALSQITNNPVITALTSELAKREADRARLTETFTPEYPKVRRLEAQIDAIRAQIQSEQGVLANTLRADYEAAQKQEALLAQALDVQKRIVNDLNQRAIDYKILKREVDTNRTIYNSLLQRLKEVEVTEGIKASNIQVIDPAEIPSRPHRPRPLFNLGLSLLLGAMGGIGLAFFLEYLDSSIKTPDDVERHLRLATLGALPEVRRRRTNGKAHDIVPELILTEDPKCPGAEAIRTLRTSLFLSTAAGPPRCILVTSTRPMEGKTCVTVNLAAALAQMGRRVVLVDCDLRRPRVHRVFGIHSDLGVTSFVTGNADVPAILHRTTLGVDVVPSGPIPPNPVELIDSSLMAALLDELSRRYDFVLLDAPPASWFADVPLLARLAGGVLFVVHAGQTPRKLAVRAVEHLRRLRARMIGVVLNRVGTGTADYDGDYYGYYGYYEYHGDSARSGDDHDHAVLDEPDLRDQATP